MRPIHKVDSMILPGGRFAPRWGYHDDHRAKDGTPEYLPALMQVRDEFAELLDVLEGRGIFRGRVLQLGVGECCASHEVWRSLFARSVVTIDLNGYCLDGHRMAGGNTHDPEIRDRARIYGPYDFLFIDAGHGFDDVMRDHRDYGPLVAKGGIIAFHDSLPRKGFEEVEVWRYLATLGGGVHQIGSEVGTSWIVQE